MYGATQQGLGNLIILHAELNWVDTITGNQQVLTAFRAVDKGLRGIGRGFVLAQRCDGLQCGLIHHPSLGQLGCCLLQHFQ